MRNDSRFSRMLHVLLHMARHDGAFTSEQIAKMLGTQSSVVRRTLAGLRTAGFVRSETGHHGGWRINGDLDSISLLDIHRALATQRLFAIGIDNSHPSCAVEAIVNETVVDALDAAERQLMDRFSKITLKQLAEEFDARAKASGWDEHHPHNG